MSLRNIGSRQGCRCVSGLLLAATVALSAAGGEADDALAIRFETVERGWADHFAHLRGGSYLARRDLFLSKASRQTLLPPLGALPPPPRALPTERERLRQHWLAVAFDDRQAKGEHASAWDQYRLWQWDRYLLIHHDTFLDLLESEGRTHTRLPLGAIDPRDGWFRTKIADPDLMTGLALGLEELLQNPYDCSLPFRFWVLRDLLDAFPVSPDERIGPMEVLAAPGDGEAGREATLRAQASFDMPLFRRWLAGIRDQAANDPFVRLLAAWRLADVESRAVLLTICERDDGWAPLAALSLAANLPMHRIDSASSRNRRRFPFDARFLETWFTGMKPRHIAVLRSSLLPHAVTYPKRCLRGQDHPLLWDDIVRVVGVLALPHHAQALGADFAAAMRSEIDDLGRAFAVGLRRCDGETSDVEGRLSLARRFSLLYPFCSAPVQAEVRALDLKEPRAKALLAETLRHMQPEGHEWPDADLLDQVFGNQGPVP